MHTEMDLVTDGPANWRPSYPRFHDRDSAMSLTLFYNAECLDCERQARRTEKLDWLGRVALATEDSPIGPVARGEIVVVDNATDKVYASILATRVVCMQVPVYFLIGLLLYVPPIRQFFGRNKQGCNGDACET